MNAYLASVLENVRTKHGNEPEFVQTVEGVFSSIEPVIEKHPEYEKVDLLGRMVEPERMFTFRVVWCDDNGQWHTNRGWRCQFNGAIGPYKGGLRFQKNVYEGIIKFLGFEQTFKNSLTEYTDFAKFCHTGKQSELYIPVLRFQSAIKWF